MKPVIASAVAALLCLCGRAVAEPIGEVDTVFKLHRPRPQDRRRRLRRPQGRAASPATCRAQRPAASAARSASPRTSRKRRSRAARSARSRSPASRSSCARRCSTSGSRWSSRSLRVVRMVDRKRNTLVYLTYSDRVIEGSPQNSVAAVPVDRATPIPVTLIACAQRRRAERTPGTRHTWASAAASFVGVGDLDGEGHVRGAAAAVADRLRAHAGDVDLLLREHLGDVAQQALAVARLDAARRPDRAPAACASAAPQATAITRSARARRRARAGCCSRRGARRRPCRA